MKKQGEETNIRAFIDIKVDGNANGGVYVESKALNHKIKDIESLGLYKVVGVVYDGTDNLEIVTKLIKEANKSTN
jgi:hypothetical protein|tara:strand:+ start:197 stop:421 length:225 start_codon:yes stop_codon:yes gene_type:complete